MIRSRWAARVARRHAHALIDWRADVARGARIGRTALEVDLPRRYRLDPQWVHDHVFLWDVQRQSKPWALALAGEDDIVERMRRAHGEHAG